MASARLSRACSFVFAWPFTPGSSGEKNDSHPQQGEKNSQENKTDGDASPGPGCPALACFGSLRGHVSIRQQLSHRGY